MPFNISTNSAAASAGYYLGKNQSALQKSLTRLASGKKIIAPYDDPGSLSVSMKLQASINRLAGAENNIKNGLSFLEVQDGVMANTGKIMSRMIELKGLSQDVLKNSSDNVNKFVEFIQMTPAFTFGAISKAKLIFSDQILAANPYGVLFAIATASLGFLKVKLVSTGPKISTWAINDAGVTFVNKEGG